MDLDSSIIINSNLSFYNSIKPKNPEESYTVLATLNNYSNGNLISLSSGTQAVLRAHHDDIQDCHAESLVKRAYKRYLIDKLLSISSNTTTLEDFNESLREQCKEENLILFISQFPCGTCRRYLGEEPLDEETGNVIKRKPGRGVIKNGKTTYVEKDNCVNKLQRWIVDGMQGRQLGEKFGIHSKIKKILIGNCEPDDNFDYEFHLNHLKSRLNNRSVTIEVVDFCCKKEFKHLREEFVFNSHKQPQPVSIVWWASPPSPVSRESAKKKIKLHGTQELIVDGRKRGLTKKLLTSDNERSKLKVANYWLRKDLLNIEIVYKRFSSSSS